MVKDRYYLEVSPSVTLNRSVSASSGEREHVLGDLGYVIGFADVDASRDVRSCTALEAVEKLPELILFEVHVTLTSNARFVDDHLSRSSQSEEDADCVGIVPVSIEIIELPVLSTGVGTTPASRCIRVSDERAYAEITSFGRS